jgi:hypothetical protein
LSSCCCSLLVRINVNPQTLCSKFQWVQAPQSIPKPSWSSP